jgi:hypothetical protein
MHNSTKTASVTNGLSMAPIDGMTRPMRMSAATAHVPCRPSHDTTAAGVSRTILLKSSPTSLSWTARTRCNSLIVCSLSRAQARNEQTRREPLSVTKHRHSY